MKHKYGTHKSRTHHHDGMWCSAGAGVRTVPETQQAREDKKEREGREREREKAENSGVDKHNVGLNK